MVTEYVAGPDLARLLREQGPLTGSNLEALAVGVAAALTAIHGAGVVHRDLKPANALLSPLGPRVIDFGIARALDAGRGQTVTGKILGTPEYMAPELVSDSRSGPPADVFAWGCVVAAAATGASPFASRTVPEALYRVVHDTPELEALEPELRSLVEAALNKDPQARPSAMDLLPGLVGQKEAQATARVAGTVRLNLSGLLTPVARVEDGAPSPATSPPPFWRRPYLVGGAAAGALLLGTAGVLGFQALPQGPPETTDVLYRDDFADDKSGWHSDETRVDVGHGYTGDGRYTTATDSSNNSRYAAAPVNAEPPRARPGQRQGRVHRRDPVQRVGRGLLRVQARRQAVLLLQRGDPPRRARAYPQGRPRDLPEPDARHPGAGVQEGRDGAAGRVRAGRRPGAGGLLGG